MQNEPPITQADRELLAAEYDADGRVPLPMSIREDAIDNVWYHHRLSLRAIAKARQQGREQGLREAAEVCSYQQAVFLSPEYATGQPLSSQQERFAAGLCRTAILALIDKPGGVG